jgi:hypothetical protein
MPSIIKERSGYAISSDGLVFSVLKNKILEQREPFINKDGYAVIKICHLNKPRLCKVHRLVAEAFLPNPENKPVVNHINGIRNDNRVKNLEWATVQENNQHAYTVNGRIGPRTGIVNEENPTIRPVIQLCEQLVPVKFWWSAFQAGAELSCPSTHITRVCKGRRKHTRGFAWRYATQEEIETERANLTKGLLL